jgi:hypothetical protein
VASVRPTTFGTWTSRARNATRIETPNDTRNVAPSAPMNSRKRPNLQTCAPTGMGFVHRTTMTMMAMTVI